MEEIQVFLVHGGMTFKSKKDYLDYLKTRDISISKKIKWYDTYLEEKLGNNYKIIRPRMPLQDNARYEEWKIHFERHVPYLKDKVILIGSSLGGIFLAKYLSENKFLRKILSAYIIAAPYDNTLPTEDLVSGFKLKSDLSLIEKNCKNVYLMFSEDDDVIPISHASKYKKKLKNSNLIIFKSKNGHFKISEFPEIVDLIKKDVKMIK